MALEIIRQAPDRVTRLALLDTSGRADTAEQTRRRSAFIELAERGRFLGVSDALLPLFLHRDKIADPELVNTVKTMARNIGQAAFIRHERTVMSRPDSRPGLWEISRPTLVLCCREDAVTPPDVHEELAAGITHSRLEIIQDCGHLSALERPAEVSAALRRWLAAS